MPRCISLDQALGPDFVIQLPALNLTTLESTALFSIEYPPGSYELRLSFIGSDPYSFSMKNINRLSSPEKSNLREPLDTEKYILSIPVSESEPTFSWIEPCTSNSPVIEVRAKLHAATTKSADSLPTAILSQCPHMLESETNVELQL